MIPGNRAAGPRPEQAFFAARVCHGTFSHRFRFVWKNGGLMAQIFSAKANGITRMVLAGAAVGVVAVIILGVVLPRSSWATLVDRARQQPVPFSHEHHVAGLGLDCRYCHTGVEVSSFAGIPATEVCMTCHSQLWTECRSAGAGAPKLCDRHAAALEPGQRRARLCLFQPLDPREQRRALRRMPRSRRQHAADRQGRVAAHAVVP